MIRYLLTFFAGAAVTTAAVIAADGHAAFFMFAAGAAFVLAGELALLGSRRRLIRAGRALLAIARSSRKRKPRPAPRPVDARVVEIQSALRNLGMDRGAARAAAAAAVAQGGSFEEMLRHALSWRTAA